MTAGEAQSDEGGELDGSLCPPPLAALARGGGQSLLRPGDPSTHIKIWSSEGGDACAVGFTCVFMPIKRVYHAKMVMGDEDHAVPVDGQCMKGAIATLLDVAEAFCARKIALCLTDEQAGNGQLICSLLYLGFEVAASRRSPLGSSALRLDLIVAWPPNRGSASSFESSQQRGYSCSGNSDATTSAEEAAQLYGEGSDSD